jgi:3-phenylpropionate/trans-cinnamate dioxygenase ferredoxin subunit
MDSKEHDVGAVSEFEPGEIRKKMVGSRAIAIVRKGDSFLAVRDLCPHQGAPLSSGTVSGTPRRCVPGEEIVLDRVGEILICPWHGWEFDLISGGTLDNPRSGRVRTYPVRVKGNRVIVNIG